MKAELWQYSTDEGIVDFLSFSIFLSQNALTKLGIPKVVCDWLILERRGGNVGHYLNVFRPTQRSVAQVGRCEPGDHTGPYTVSMGPNELDSGTVWTHAHTCTRTHTHTHTHTQEHAHTLYYLRERERESERDDVLLLPSGPGPDRIRSGRWVSGLL